MNIKRYSILSLLLLVPAGPLRAQPRGASVKISYYTEEFSGWGSLVGPIERTLHNATDYLTFDEVIINPGYRSGNTFLLDSRAVGSSVELNDGYKDMKLVGETKVIDTPDSFLAADPSGDERTVARIFDEAYKAYEGGEGTLPELKKGYIYEVDSRTAAGCRRFPFPAPPRSRNGFTGSLSITALRRRENRKP